MRGNKDAREECGTATPKLLASAHRDILSPRAGVLGRFLDLLEREWQWAGEPLRVSIRPLGPRSWYYTKIIPHDDGAFDHMTADARAKALNRLRYDNAVSHPYPLGDLLLANPSWAPDFTERPYLWRVLVSFPGGVVVPWPSDEATAFVRRVGWDTRVQIADRAIARRWEAMAPPEPEAEGRRVGWAELTAADREAIAAERET